MSRPPEVRHVLSGRLRLRLSFADFRRTDLATWFRALPGVSDVRLNPACRAVVLAHEGTTDSLLREIGRRWTELPASATVAAQSLPREAPEPSTVRSLMLPTVAGMLSMVPLPATRLAAAALTIISAVPMAIRAAAVLRTERRLTVDVLDATSVGIAVSRGATATAAFMTWLIRLGDVIRDRTAARSQAALSGLVGAKVRQAWIRRGSEIVQVPVEDVVAGDVAVCDAGSVIPVDGEVTDGLASVDQKSITGESEPAVKRPADTVFAGASVQLGRIDVRAARVGSDTLAAQVVHFVQQAPQGDTRIQNHAELFADRLVAPSLAFAFGVHLASPDVNRLISMLMVDLGTGIRVAAPTCVLASMVHAARNGILFKNGRALETLSRADTLVFDKTGTLTGGAPVIAGVEPLRDTIDARRTLALAAAAESRLAHPLASALVAYARTAGLTHLATPTRLRFEIGLGVEADVGGIFVQVGGEGFFRRIGTRLGTAWSRIRRLHRSGYSTLLVALDGTPAAVVPYRDELRPEAHATISSLRRAGIRRISLLTGDTPAVAAALSARLALDDCFAGVMPLEKADIVAQMQRTGRVVAMVGDGVNDSAALVGAHVGIAMKGSAELAQTAADVVLFDNDLGTLVTALEISRHAMRLIREDYAIVAALNAVALVLALPRALVSPGVVAALSNGSAILAALNAVRPML